MVATIKAGAKPYPMLPYMGVLFTAIGDNLAKFMQGQQTPEQALADATRSYNTRRQGGRLHSVEGSMRHRTFLFFILPSLFVMLLFIALPIVSGGVPVTVRGARADPG